MPKPPRLTAEEAEWLLLQNGFACFRGKGEHRIYLREETRVVLRFHAGHSLHPQVVERMMRLMNPGEAARS